VIDTIPRMYLSRTSEVGIVAGLFVLYRIVALVREASISRTDVDEYVYFSVTFT
jgi:hypothetical protein